MCRIHIILTCYRSIITLVVRQFEPCRRYDIHSLGIINYLCKAFIGCRSCNLMPTEYHLLIHRHRCVLGLYKAADSVTFIYIFQMLSSYIAHNTAFCKHLIPLAFLLYYSYLAVFFKLDIFYTC